MKSMSKRAISETEKKRITIAYTAGIHMSQDGVQPMARAIYGVWQWITSSESTEAKTGRYQKVAQNKDRAVYHTCQDDEEIELET